MSFKDVAEVSSAILLSLGGGGAIVYHLSGYLGKLWADKALQDQQQKYVQLNLQLQNQLDTAARRLQVDLDTLGYLHKLRTEESINKIAGLWKRIATLQNWFNLIAREGVKLVPADEEAQKKQDEEFRLETYRSLADCERYLLGEMLFIPKNIADVALQAVRAAQREKLNFFYFRSIFPTNLEESQPYYIIRQKSLAEFNDKVDELQKIARDYLGGPPAEKKQ